MATMNFVVVSALLVCAAIVPVEAAPQAQPRPAAVAAGAG